MKLFFSSDPHYDHKNIIKHCNRPFSDVQEMNEALQSNWNSVVTPDDEAWILGDICFGDIGSIISHLGKLNGRCIRILWGNHDRALRRKYYTVEQAFNGRILFCGDSKEIKVGEQRITLNHYAMRVWNKSHRGAWHLYGHSHGTLPDDPNSLSFDVGVDCHNFFPIDFAKVTEIMSKKTYKPVDHHGANTNE